MTEDPHCRICWDKVYGLWVDPAPHGGACPFGATIAHECQQAMMRARQSADAIKMLAAPAAQPRTETGADLGPGSST